MPEIIPNLHPAAVHLPIALTLLAVLSSLAARFLIKKPISPQLAVVGHWALWLAALSALVAAGLGLFAYSNVNHDEAGHIAMTLHRNWAIPTAIGLILLAAWDAWKHKAAETMSVLSLVILFGLSASISVTAWLGGELVFRHGIGVLSLPAPENETAGHSHHDHGTEHQGDGHAHQHASAEKHAESQNH